MGDADPLAIACSLVPARPGRLFGFVFTADSAVNTDEESDALDWLSDWLGQNSRFPLGGLCLVLGVGFLLKSLNHLGVF